MKKEKIVVIGGGFAGLNFIKKIDKSRYDVLLIDKHNFHSFPPLFYQVASSGLEPSSISFPFRRELRKRRAKGVTFNMGEVLNVNLSAKSVTTNLETVSYDKLVIAAGTTNNFFGMDNLRESVYTIKSTPQSIRCRNDILDRLEQAVVAADRDRRRELLNFVVIGGGPTGVEIAGAIGEMKRYILRREYPGIDPEDMTITVIEGADRLLRTMNEESSAQALKYLNALMVNVKLGLNMKSYSDGEILFTDGSKMKAGMVIWTAGVTGEKINTDKPLPLTRGNRIEVDRCNKVVGFDDIYALGDICSIVGDEDYPNGHPQLAQPAIQQAANLARNLNDGTNKAFRYRDKGSMATVGRNRAVVEMKRVHVKGFAAWLAWMFVHLITLLGMRNKLTVLINWLWAYFSYGTSLRLLIHPSRFPKRHHWGE